MKSLFFVVLVFAVCVLGDIPSAEIAALRALYESTNGEKWTHNDNWLKNSDPCSWYGVGCDSNNTHVVSLFLANNNLDGEIPPKVAGLGALTSVDFSSNKLTGGLGGLTVCTQLTGLSLKDNQLTGSLEVKDLTELRWVHLDFNKFSGILDNFCSCKNLQVLGLTDNLMSGAIPDCLVALPKLQTLFLGGNSLTGSIPVIQAPSLQEIDASRNALSGTLSSSFETQTSLNSLTEVVVSKNRFTGQLPAYFNGTGKRDNLAVIDVHSNFFYGELPSGIPAAPLQILYASENNFSGFLPNSYVNGVVPIVNVARNPFVCPLPNGAEKIGAKCSMWNIVSVSSPGYCVVGQECKVSIKGSGFVPNLPVQCRFDSDTPIVVSATVKTDTMIDCDAFTPKTKAKASLSIVIHDTMAVSAGNLPFPIIDNNKVRNVLRRSNADPVHVRIHGMSKCPDFGSIIDIFEDVVTTLGEDVVDVQLGWIMKENAEYPTGFWSLHGQTEVMGNGLDACAMELYGETKGIQFAKCLADTIASTPINANDCAKKIGLDYDQLTGCAYGSQGKGLLEKGMNQAVADGATWSPTVVINDESYCLWHSIPCKASQEKDFGKAVCDLYTGTKPKGCSKYQ